MRIFELETDDRLNNLIVNVGYVKKLNDSFADNTAQYRRFAAGITLPFDVLKECCRTYERNLLIDAYTYAEQLLKNFYYHLLEKDTAENKYFQRFINSKLNVERFSPNAKFDYMEQGIKNDLFPEFEFLITKKLSQITKYNELIKSRHRYAHMGEYLFDFLSINEVLEVECYVTAVFEMIIGAGIDYRIVYQERHKRLYKQIQSLICLYEKEDNNPKILELKEKVRDTEKGIYKNLKQFYKDYYRYMGRIQIISDYVLSIEEMLSVRPDSHKKVKSSLTKIYDEMKKVFYS